MIRICRCIQDDDGNLRPRSAGSLRLGLDCRHEPRRLLLPQLPRWKGQRRKYAHVQRSCILSGSYFLIHTRTLFWSAPLCLCLLQFTSEAWSSLWTLLSRQCLQSEGVTPPCPAGFGTSLSWARRGRSGSSGPGCPLLGDLRQTCWWRLASAVEV